MDPLTALGLASNVVSLVGAAYKAVTVCHEIYTLGASVENLGVTETAKSLEKCYQDLNNSLSASTSQKDLRLLAQNCLQTAQQLSSELEALQVGKSGRRAAVLKFVKTKLKAGRIEKLKADLDEYQRVIDTRILIDVRKWLQYLSEGQARLDTSTSKKLAALATNLRSENAPVSAEIKVLIENAITVNIDEHAKTRKHVDNALASSALSQAKIQLSKEERERALASLHYKDINLRSNEVAYRHAETFDWILDESDDSKRNHLRKWLVRGKKIFWINGSPGSGKSTLMKFVISDPRTVDLLNKWSIAGSCIILRAYFWLAGSELQRSMKGFLCSLLYQIFDHETLQNKCFEKMGPEFKGKRSIQDWSTFALRKLFIDVIAWLSREHDVCIFVDGLDEFDQDDDKGKLLDFLEELSHYSRIKLCVSSRPEFQLQRRLSAYPKLSLQDLTRADMQLFLEAELRAAFLREHCPLPEEARFKKLVDDMLDKANGVFLWVHYAMQSFRRGISNQEDGLSLEDRLEDLPAGMSQLYEDMWQRLNGDQKRYREEASKYFQFILSYDREYVSLLALMLSTHADLRKCYLANFEKQNVQVLRELCCELQKRIETRCAGLLECTPEWYYSWHDPRGLKHSTSFDDKHSCIKSRRSTLFGESSHPIISEIKPSLPISKESADRLQKLHLGRPLRWYHRVHVSFFHRTARDFLQETKIGREIAENLEFSYLECLEAICESKVCLLLQDITPPEEFNLFDVLYLGRLLEKDRAVKLFQTTERACEALISKDASGRNLIWLYDDGLDFLIELIKIQPPEEILQSFIESMRGTSSSTYLTAMYQAAGKLYPGLYSIPLSLISPNFGVSAKMKQWMPRSNLISTPLEALITGVLDCRHLVDLHARHSESRGTDNGTYIVEMARNVEFILSNIEDEDVFNLYIKDYENPFEIFPEEGWFAVWLEVGAYWLYEILPRIFHSVDPDSSHSGVRFRDIIDITRYSKPLKNADQTAKLLAFSPNTSRGPYLGIHYEVPGKDTQWLGKSMCEIFQHNIGHEMLEQDQIERLLFQSNVRSQCSIVDAKDWQQMKGFRNEQTPGSRPLWQADTGISTKDSAGVWSLRAASEGQSLRYGVLPDTLRPVPERRHSVGGDYRVEKFRPYDASSDDESD